MSEIKRTEIHPGQVIGDPLDVQIEILTVSSLESARHGARAATARVLAAAGYWTDPRESETFTVGEEIILQEYPQEYSSGIIPTWDVASSQHPYLSVLQDEEENYKFEEYDPKT
jgi:hypothetical protein